MARILYPRLFAPVSQSAETVTVDRWAQPTSQPVRCVPPQQNTGTFAPVSTAAETVTADRWAQPASQPTRRVPTQQPAALFGPVVSSTSEIITADKWVQPPSQPTRRTPAQQPSGLVNPPKQPESWNPNDTAGPIALSNNNLTATATSTASQGVRSTTAKTGGKVYIEFTMPGMVANTSNAVVGIANLTEQMNQAGQLGSTGGNSMGFYASQPAQATFVNTISLNSLPATVSGTVIVGMAIDFTTTPPTLYVTDQAMQAASLPWNNQATANPATSTLGISLTGLGAGPYFAAYNDASDTPGIACTANFGASAFTYLIPFGFTSWDGSQQGLSTEPVTADRWVQPPTQPTRRIPTQQPAGAVAPISTLPETVTADRWFQPTSQPVRARQVQQQTGGVAPVTTATPQENITLDKWAQPTNQPTRRAAPQQPAGAFAPIVWTGEVVLLDKWFQPPSQPTRRVPAWPPAFAFAPALPLPNIPEVLTMDKWFQPPSQPTRRRPAYAALTNGFVTQYTLIANPLPPPSARRALVSWLD